MTETEKSPARFTRIHGLSERTQLPRCGKVRLGERRQKGQGPGAVQYPSDLSYFRFDDTVCDRWPKILEAYANPDGAMEPRELDIMLPVEDETEVFPQSLRYYGRSRGLRCIGNGQEALRFVCEKCRTMDCACPAPAMVRMPQPCKCALYDEGKCKDSASLMFLLPRVTWEGCWQLDTHSYHNIVHLNSALKFIRGILGRISVVPLKLRRVPVELTHQGKKRVHWLLSLGFDGTAEDVLRIRAQGNGLVGIGVGGRAAPLGELPPPVLEGDEAPVEQDEEEAAEAPAASTSRQGEIPDAAVPVKSAERPAGPRPPHASIGPLEMTKLSELSKELYLYTNALLSGWLQAHNLPDPIRTAAEAAAVIPVMEKAVKELKAGQREGRTPASAPGAGDVPPDCPKCGTNKYVVEGKKALTHECSYCHAVIEE